MRKSFDLSPEDIVDMASDYLDTYPGYADAEEYAAALYKAMAMLDDYVEELFERKDR